MKYCLEKGELVRLDCAKEGVILRCMSGTLWVTDGDGRDYLLQAGKSFAIPTGIVAVAEALQSVECAVAGTVRGRNEHRVAATVPYPTYTAA
jgi:quercetin dioxygenase-like cupin family protein